MSLQEQQREILVAFVQQEQAGIQQFETARERILQVSTFDGLETEWQAVNSGDPLEDVVRERAHQLIVQAWDALVEIPEVIELSKYDYMDETHIEKLQELVIKLLPVVLPQSNDLMVLLSWYNWMKDINAGTAVGLVKRIEELLKPLIPEAQMDILITFHPVVLDLKTEITDRMKELISAQNGGIKLRTWYSNRTIMGIVEVYPFLTQHMRDQIKEETDFQTLGRYRKCAEQNLHFATWVDERLEQLYPGILPDITDFLVLMGHRGRASDDSKAQELVDARIREVLGGETDLKKVISAEFTLGNVDHLQDAWKVVVQTLIRNEDNAILLIECRELINEGSFVDGIIVARLEELVAGIQTEAVQEWFYIILDPRREDIIIPDSLTSILYQKSQEILQANPEEV